MVVRMHTDHRRVGPMPPSSINSSHGGVGSVGMSSNSMGGSGMNVNGVHLKKMPPPTRHSMINNGSSSVGGGSRSSAAFSSSKQSSFLLPSSNNGMHGMNGMPPSTHSSKRMSMPASAVSSSSSREFHEGRKSSVIMGVMGNSSNSFNSSMTGAGGDHPHSSSHVKNSASSKVKPDNSSLSKTSNNGKQAPPLEKFESKNSYSSAATSCTSSSTSSYSPYLSSDDEHSRDRLLSFPPNYYQDYYTLNNNCNGCHEDGTSSQGSHSDPAHPFHQNNGNHNDDSSSNASSSIKNNNNNTGKTPSIPSYFLCPITNTLMTDPVINTEGHTFERASILRWIVLTNCDLMGGISPITGNELKMEDLMEDRVVKGAMEKARKEAWVRYILEGGGEEVENVEGDHHGQESKECRSHADDDDDQDDQEAQEEEEERRRKKKLRKQQKKTEKENRRQESESNQPPSSPIKSLKKKTSKHQETKHPASRLVSSEPSNNNGNNGPPPQPQPQASSSAFPPPPPLGSKSKSFHANGTPAAPPPPSSLSSKLDKSNRSITKSQPMHQKPRRRETSTISNDRDASSTVGTTATVGTSISSSSSIMNVPPPPPPPPAILPSITVSTNNPNITLSSPNGMLNGNSGNGNTITTNNIISAIGGGASVCSAISTPTIHHNGWMAQLGVYKVVCPLPGLLVTQDVHRRSRTVKRRRKRFCCTTSATNPNAAGTSTNGSVSSNQVTHHEELEEMERPEDELVIPPGSFVNVIETQTHGGRIRGKVVWETEEENDMVEFNSSSRKGRLASGLGRTSRFLRRGRKSTKANGAEDLNSITSSSVMSTKSVVSYTGWISLQWAEDDEDDQDILMSELPPPSSCAGSVASGPSLQNSVSSNRRRSTFGISNGHGANVMADETQGPWTHPIPLGVYRVNFGAGLPLRETSERDSPVIEKLERGRVVEVVQTEVKNNRVRARCIVPNLVDPDGNPIGYGSNNKKSFQSGWISLLNLSGSSAASPVPLGAYVTVSESGCIVTEGGRLDSKVKEIISPGSCIEICSTRIEDGVVRGLLSSGGYISLFSSLGKATVPTRNGTNKIESGRMFAMPVPLGTYQNLQDGLVITTGVSSTSPMITKLKQDACVEIVETRVEDGRVRGRINSVIYGGATTEASGFINLFEPKYRWAKIVCFRGGRPVNPQGSKGGDSDAAVRK